MGAELIHITLRGALVVVIWMAVWRLVQPATGWMRVVRAGVLVLSLLVVLAVVRMISP